jgi:3-oxoacyl-[acyl-carrier-protein] synthase-3
MEDPVTAILFGDAAGAMVVGRKTDGEDTGFLGNAILRSEYNPTAIWMRNGNCPTPPDFLGADRRSHNRHFLHMEGGPRVLRNAVNRMADAVVECLGFTPDDLKDGNPELMSLLQRVKLVPHQANGRIVDGLQEKLGCPRENVYRTIYTAANSSAATNAYTLDYAIREGNMDRIPPEEGSGRMGTIVTTDRRIRKGDLVVVVSIGAGYVYGAMAFVQAY